LNLKGDILYINYVIKNIIFKWDLNIMKKKLNKINIKLYKSFLTGTIKNKYKYNFKRTI